MKFNYFCIVLLLDSIEVNIIKFALRKSIFITWNNIGPSFRIIALSLPPALTSGENSSKGLDSHLRYITSDLGFTYHYLPQGSPQDMQELLTKSFQKYPDST